MRYAQCPHQHQSSPKPFPSNERIPLRYSADSWCRFFTSGFLATLPLGCSGSATQDSNRTAADQLLVLSAACGGNGTAVAGAFSPTQSVHPTVLFTRRGHTDSTGWEIDRSYTIPADVETTELVVCKRRSTVRSATCADGREGTSQAVHLSAHRASDGVTVDEVLFIDSRTACPTFGENYPEWPGNLTAQMRWIRAL